MSYEIDINCDMGESYGRNKIANDANIIPYVSSCNIACGMHGGDYNILKSTIKAALENNVQIGAHPSFPDFYGFGRRKTNINIEDLEASLNYQLEYLHLVLEESGTIMSYVKPHGALYNTLANSEKLASGFIHTIQKFNPSLKIMGLAGSVFEKLVKESNVSFIPEAFADRNYNKQGNLVLRSHPKAIIHKVEEVIDHVFNLIKNQKILSVEKSEINIYCKSICVHGDHPNTLNILKALSSFFEENNINKKAF